MKKIAMLSVVALVGMWMVLPSVGFSKPEFAKKEDKPCTFCHVKPMKGDENLNAVGKCYKEKKDLKACQEKK